MGKDWSELICNWKIRWELVWNGSRPVGTGLELANAHQDWPETKKYQLEPAQTGKY